MSGSAAYYKSVANKARTALANARDSGAPTETIKSIKAELAHAVERSGSGSSSAARGQSNRKNKGLNEFKKKKSGKTATTVSSSARGKAARLRT